VQETLWGIDDPKAHVGAVVLLLRVFLQGVELKMVSSLDFFAFQIFFSPFLRLASGEDVHHRVL